MARINLKKISTKTLMEMTEDELFALAKRGLDKNSMNPEEYSKAHRSNLAEITSRIVSTANRRIKSLGKTKIGQISPAYQRAIRMSPSGLFSVKGKDWNDLLNTIKEAKQFLISKTSSVKGWAEVRKSIETDIGGELNTKYKAEKFWEAYRRLYELKGGLIGRKKSGSNLSSERVQQLLYNTITNKRDESGNRVIDWRNSIDKILKATNEDFETLYEMDNSTDVGASRQIKDDNKEE